MKKVGQEVFSLKDFKDVVFDNQRITLDKRGVDNVMKGFVFLQNFSADKLIYGINTGFGPMAQYKVSDDKLLELQYNLIRSHCTGNGALMQPLDVKALMLARLKSLMKGYSGIHKQVLEVLESLINNNVTPCVYEHGGVGASGDLVQLAHLGLVLIGEGEVIYEGKVQPTKSIFKKLKITPLNIRLREGLAIINGTSAMTGIGLNNIIHSKRLLNWSVYLSAATNEVINAFNDHFSEGLNDVKLHPGQQKIANALRKLLSGSKMIKVRSDLFYQAENINHDVFNEKVQEYYSLRCVPQILGPVLDTLSNCEQVLINEFNSANDNPIIDYKNNQVYHGGNFHGDYVSLEMDKLKIAITKLTMLSERQLNFLLNDKLNQKLPPFVNLGKLGLNYGMQGIQFTATSTTAENQTLSFPMYVHSIPNNNDNQDIVSMGCNGALITKKVIENAYSVLAIQAMTIAQAIDYLKCESQLAKNTKLTYKGIRNVFPVFVNDAPLYKDLENVINFIKLNLPENIKL